MPGLVENSNLEGLRGKPAVIISKCVGDTDFSEKHSFQRIAAVHASSSGFFSPENSTPYVGFGDQQLHQCFLLLRVDGCVLLPFLELALAPPPNGANTETRNRYWAQISTQKSL